MANRRKVEAMDFSEDPDEMESGSEDNDVDEEEMNRNSRKANVDKGKGAFGLMGLYKPVLMGILRQGYKYPTPIQRKAIPAILNGSDVVATARTGSGKTAAFVIPMLDKLKEHDPTGVRAIILSPTRELAEQTFKFAIQIGKKMSLKFSTILGGDRIENHFREIHSCPDVLIATPGRLMHVLAEMNMKLSNVDYVVFDEADRLFELNFQEQLEEILKRLPETRQTLLFSATLPKILCDFVSVSLSSPKLITLHKDHILNEGLNLHFLECRADSKMGILHYLLREVIKPSESTLVFVATKHHVEYVNAVLEKAGFKCSVSHSGFDVAARRMYLERFRRKRTNILIATDIAARGLDIPVLDNVINFHFPDTPKLFIHRVGRVARAGKSGSAYSLVTLDEKAYVYDLHVHLGRTVNFADLTFEENKDVKDMYGQVPESVVQEEDSLVVEQYKDYDIQGLIKVAENGYKKYITRRRLASKYAFEEMKNSKDKRLGLHPLFGSEVCENAQAVLDYQWNLRSLKIKPKRGFPTLELKKPLSAAREWEEPAVPKKKMKMENSEYFIPYPSTDLNKETRDMEEGFMKVASMAMMDLQDDDTDKKQKTGDIWDRKKKKFVRGKTETEATRKNEAGVKITGKGKKSIYKTWLQKSKITEKEDNSDDDQESNVQRNTPTNGRPWNRFGSSGPRNLAGGRVELKSKGQILKGREEQSQNKFKNRPRSSSGKDHQKNSFSKDRQRDSFGKNKSGFAQGKGKSGERQGMKRKTQTLKNAKKQNQPKFNTRSHKKGRARNNKYKKSS